MTDLLQQELTRPPVTVTIGGKECPLAFTMAAAIAYKQATGKSLFNLEESRSISLVEDPERWLACLWAGLHQEDAAGKWSAPISLQELKRLKIAQANLVEIDAAMWTAFRGDSPKPREEDSRPNAAAAEDDRILPVQGLSLTPPGSTPVPAADLVLAGQSS
jgi:hypothetical protein